MQTTNPNRNRLLQKTNQKGEKMNEIHLGNRTVGKINAFGAFETHRREDIHLFKNFKGLGFNEKLMEISPRQKSMGILLALSNRRWV